MEHVLAALALGISAGFSPGPLMILVLVESITGGWRRGALAAAAPLLTDGLFIAVTFWALGALPPPFLSAIEGVGGLLLFYLARKTWLSSYQPIAVPAAAAADPDTGNGLEAVRPRVDHPLAPLWRGTALNMFNPNAWVFWLTAGGPIFHQAWLAGIGWAGAFLAIFMSLLVGIKIGMGVLAGGPWLGGRHHRRLLQLAGVCLALLGLRALWRSASFFFL